MEPAVTPSDRTDRRGFVGRERELVLLDDATDDARAGHGRVALIAGGAGIGKTRLVTELGRRAESRGGVVLWGRCYESEGAPAFWPWQQVIRDYFECHDPAAIASDLGVAVDLVSQMVPGLQAVRATHQVPADLEPIQARFQQFDAVTSFLRAAAATHARRTGEPLLILLDDLHWADEPSLLLLQFVARHIARSPLLILGTYRDVGVPRGHPLTQALGELAREPLCRRVVLPALSEANVAEYLLLAAPDRPRACAFAPSVYRVSEGNPFVMGEIVRWLESEGQFERGTPESGVAIPSSVRDVIALRLARLAEPSSHVLELAAVIGQEFGVSVLVQLAQEDGRFVAGRDSVLEALEETEAAGLIVSIPEALGRFRFSHTLIRETIYERLPSVRRMVLHGRIASALETLYQGAIEAHLSELAHHFVQAAPRGESAKAVTYARRAGDHAMEMLAHEESVRLYQMALQVLDQAAAASPHEQIELLLALGEARIRSGDIAAAGKAFSEAAEAARRIGDAWLLARAALGFRANVEVNVADTFVVGLLEEALAAAAPDDVSLRLPIMIGLVRARRDTDRRMALSEEAVRLAEQTQNLPALAEALEVRRLALWRPDNAAERLTLSTEVVRLAGATGNRASLLQGRWWRINDLLELGMIDEYEAELAAYAQLTAESRQPLYAWIAMGARTTHTLLVGLLDETESLAQQTLAMGRRMDRPGVFASYGIQMYLLRYLQGRIGEVEASTRANLERRPQHHPTRTILTLVYAGLGRTEDVRTEFERLAAHDFADFPRDSMWLTCMCHLAEVAIMLDDRPRMARLYELLRPFSGMNVVVGIGGGVLGAVDRYAGMLAAARQSWDDADRCFDAALALNTSMRARPWLALTQTDYAAALLARGGAGDHTHATELLRVAAATGEQLGMAGVVRRSAELLERAGVATVAEPPETDGRHEALPSGLTAREVEVLTLLASGKTNGEIAEALVVSPFTVARHISNIYVKISAHGRAEATLYALQHGLVQFRVL